MNVDFLDPVSDRLLAHNLMLPDQIIGRNLRIHTQQDGFPDLKDVRVVFLTLDDLAQEEESLHFRFRKQFYQLFSGNWDFSVADLGQLISGESPEDTYFVIQSIKN